MAKKYELNTIKISNDSNMLIYPKATQTDLNIMACILSKASQENNRHNYSIELSKKELLRCLNWSASTEKRHWTDSEFQKYIDNHFSDVALSILYHKKTEHTTGKFVLFQGIEYANDFNKYDEEQAVVKVRLGDDAYHMIFSLGKNNPFYKYRLVDYIKIKSTYAKRMYQILMQWRKVGRYDIDYEEFRTLLNVPKSYNARNINLVLKPIQEELCPIFENLKITRLNNKNKKNKLVGFRFTWKPITLNEEDSHDLEGNGITYEDSFPATPDIKLREEPERLSEEELNEIFKLRAKRNEEEKQNKATPNEEECEDKLEAMGVDW